MKAQAKATEEQIHVTLNQCDKTIKSTVTVTEEVVQGLIVKVIFIFKKKLKSVFEF
jgi:hypothetical protein